MPSIHFHNEEVEFNLENESRTSSWLVMNIKAEGFSLEEINFIFCNDSFLHQMNVNYLNHDTLTDIITFDQSDQTKVIEGDIFISIERVEANANELGISFNNELDRVMIHGVLHLMGHEDKNDAQKSAMRKKEEACLSLRP